MWYALHGARIMFLGTDQVTIDEKGRFAVPARYRLALRESCSGQLVVFPHHRDPCLIIQARPDWMSFAEKITTSGSLNPQVRAMQRLYIARARDLEMDKQGRLLLPAPLRDSAGLNGKAALAGVGNTLELWDEAAWFENEASMLANQTDEELAQGLEGMNF